MKRYGFVSNSSSSSFIIDEKAYKNVFELSCEMIRIRDEDYGFGSDKELLNSIKNSDKDPNSNICFPTCNYDTYIMKFKDSYIVASCNNHPFYEKLEGQKGISSEISEEFDIEDWEALDYFHHGRTFWHPEGDITGRSVSYDEVRKMGFKDIFAAKRCGKCFKSKILKDDKLVCPRCGEK